MKSYKPEQITTLLRKIKATIANGYHLQSCEDAVITAQSCSRWRIHCPRGMSEFTEYISVNN
jgi:hypothetical protein